MRRALFLIAASLIAMPAAAQDHSGHTMPSVPATQERHGHLDHAAPPVPAPEDHTGHAMPAPKTEHAGHGAHAGHEPAPAAKTAPEPLDHEHDHHPAPQAPAAHAGHDMGAAPAASGPPPRAFEGPRHAADVLYGPERMAPARKQAADENGRFRGGAVIVDRLELRAGDGVDAYLWDVQGWYGGDIDKLWLKTEGEGAFGDKVEEAEVQALWSHAIGPWFDLQAGARYDLKPRGRAHAVLGLQGLAPYMFEIDAAAFLSEKGDVTARIEAEHDMRITQRLILQPRAEVEFAAQDVPELGLGAGLTSVETGLRLRYEIAREFAPYIGIGYEAKVGETADRARAAGEDPDRAVLLIGIRAWF
ncbi:MAG: copper resistance protein B [Bdellovibrionales bacterium]